MAAAALLVLAGVLSARLWAEARALRPVPARRGAR
jgi:hypothetical protein